MLKLDINDKIDNQEDKKNIEFLDHKDYLKNKLNVIY